MTARNSFIPGRRALIERAYSCIDASFSAKFGAPGSVITLVRIKVASAYGGLTSAAMV
jgi:hypothetical protein